MNKYNAKKTMVDGIVFDSKKEAHRYGVLKMLQDQGYISNLQTQVRFELIPTQYEEVPRYSKRGKPLKPGRRCVCPKVSYVADFVYTVGGDQVVEDVKGLKTDVYKLKKAMMRWIHGITIYEV